MHLWKLDNLDSIDGYKTEVLGSPRIIDSDDGAAVEFDGENDALVVDVNPLAGLAEFTAELVFRPYADGPTAQRFFHIQEDDNDSRLLFETRLTANNEWILDAFINTGGKGYVLFIESHRHPIGHWYHVAIVVGGGMFRSYTNGEAEAESAITFVPQKEGRTSIGVRMNLLSWFKGAMRSARFSPSALKP